MKNTKVIVAHLVVIVLIISSVALYYYFAQQSAERKGREKLQTAIDEVRVEHPSLDNPCLGSSVGGADNYVRLNDRTIEELKAQIIKTPGDC